MMKNNLEDIPYDQAVSRDGLSWKQYRKTLEPHYGRVYADIFKGYFFMLLVISSLVLLHIYHPLLSWVACIPAAVLLGYTIAYLALFIHEAGHFNIHPDKKKNDRLAAFLVCLPFGIAIRAYRKIHWQHHVHLGSPEDTETSYFHALTRLFLLETFTGIHLLRTLRKKKGNPLVSPALQKENRNMLLAALCFHAVILAGFISTGQYPAMICWLLGFGVFFPFFASIRQLLEHRDERASNATDFTRENHGRLSRLFVHNMISSSFGAAGFTRHLIHHWDPGVSYTRLKDAEAFLERCPATEDIIRLSRTTYPATAKKLLQAR